MLIKDPATLESIHAADHSVLVEILHPDRDNVGHRYSLARALIKPGKASLRHRLTSSEVYYILHGAGVMHVDEEAARVHAGHAVYIPGGAVQWVENTGVIDLALLCIVDPAWSKEDEEVVG